MNKLAFFIIGFVTLLLGISGYLAGLEPASQYITYWDYFAIYIIFVVIASFVVILIELLAGSLMELNKKTDSQNELALAFLAGLLYPLWKVGRFFYKFSKLEK